MIFRDGIDISAPSDVVWEVFSDVERWPDWTASVRRASFVDTGRLAVGAAVRIEQPRLPKVTWVVTDLVPGRSWAWTATTPGAKTVAEHVVTPMGPSTTRVDQMIDQRGVLGTVFARLYANLTRRYLTMEAEGLRSASEVRAARSA